MNNLWTVFIFTVALRVGVGQFLQTAELQVFLGESVVLPCNGSGFPADELQVYWEALGKDVLSLNGEKLSIGRGFEDRVNFITDPAVTQDFSIILTDVMLNDGEIYECLWKGTIPICSVLLYVMTLETPIDHVESNEGDDVTLNCFGNIPKNKPYEDITIQWVKDERVILRLSSGQMEILDKYSSIITLPDQQDISRGIFSLGISSVRAFDQGDYQCRYKISDYGDLQSGFPERHALTVWAVFSGLPAITDFPSSLSDTETDSTAAASTYATDTYETDTYATDTFVNDANTTDTNATDSYATYTYVNDTYTTDTNTTASYTTYTNGTDSYVNDTNTTDINATDSYTTYTNATDTYATDTYATSTQTEPNNTLPAHTAYEANTHTHNGSTERNTEKSTSATDTDPHTISHSHGMTDTLLPGTVSGQRDHQFSDQQIPWIRIGLISGVLLVTALLLAFLLLSGRI
ncbi:uncharacterized protein [Danio rerio]|uniref:Ig-like domain-containing protein n=1 Tax=Danio rerio TaxID=7955 RepID=A0A8M1PUG0_DANRE|nr:uncharacterized protein LOC795531 [Danio rerio]|eukprot:XP_001335742.1 uncharacterized protein LOC795531 [Danio rerio]